MLLQTLKTGLFLYPTTFARTPSLLVGLPLLPMTRPAGASDSNAFLAEGPLDVERRFHLAASQAGGSPEEPPSGYSARGPASGEAVASGSGSELDGSNTSRSVVPALVAGARMLASGLVALGAAAAPVVVMGVELVGRGLVAAGAAAAPVAAAGLHRLANFLDPPTAVSVPPAARGLSQRICLANGAGPGTGRVGGSAGPQMQ